MAEKKQSAERLIELAAADLSGEPREPRIFLDDLPAGGERPSILFGSPGESKSDFASQVGIPAVVVRAEMTPEERAAFAALGELDSQGFFFLDEMDAATPEQMELLDMLRWLPSPLPADRVYDLIEREYEEGE